MARWALITGASSGLGVEFARLAAAEGWNLVLTARRLDRLQALARSLSTAHGIQTVEIQADLSQPGAADSVWDRASDGRAISCLVNNAGTRRFGPFGDGGRADEAASVQINVAAYTTLMQRAVADMRQRGTGMILNVASVAGFLPGPGMAVYHASKAYALSLSEAVARELAGSGITVSALCPGSTDTGFRQAAGLQPARPSLLPKGRPDRVAKAGWDGMKAGKRIVVTPFHNAAFAIFPRIAPRRSVTWAASRFLARTH